MKNKLLTLAVFSLMLAVCGLFSGCAPGDGCPANQNAQVTVQAQSLCGNIISEYKQITLDQNDLIAELTACCQQHDNTVIASYTKQSPHSLTVNWKPETGNSKLFHFTQDSEDIDTVANTGKDIISEVPKKGSPFTAWYAWVAYAGAALIGLYTYFKSKYGKNKNSS